MSSYSSCRPKAGSDLVAPDNWRSLHIWFDAPTIYSETADAVILDQAVPIARQAAEQGAGRFFFVRYNEGGPHIRLRIAAGGLSPCSLSEIVDAAVADHAAYS